MQHRPPPLLLTAGAAARPSPLSLFSPPQAAASIEVYPEQGPIRLADVQNLLLWVLGEGANPRWCFVKARASQGGVVGFRGNEQVPPLHCRLPLL